MKGNIIINIPHSLTHIPEAFLERVKSSTRSRIINWHLYTDDLFANNNCNIVKADVSKIVCDMERFKDDAKERMSNLGMGVVYTRTSKGKKLIEFDSGYIKSN